jgi:hypothetical protein
MPGVIDEQLFETDTIAAPAEDRTIESRLIDVRGAQHISVSLFLGPEGGDALLSYSIGFLRTAGSRWVLSHKDVLRENNRALSRSVPVAGPLLQVFVIGSSTSEGATVGGWVYGVREAS